MQPVFILILYGLLFIGVFFLVDGTAGFVRSARTGEAAIERRLTGPGAEHFRVGEVKHSIIRQEAKRPWARFIPLFPRFLALLQSSGTGVTPERAIVLMAFVSVITFVPLYMLLPRALLAIAALAALASGVG